MSAQYDAIAKQYRLSKASPLRTYIEAYSFFGLVGDVSGQTVLDLACGEGFYSRRLKKLGATRVVGVDISSEMIRLAEECEASDVLGVEYICAPVESMPGPGVFDIVVAAYLLHYAVDEEQLLKMCRKIVAALPPGGRFVALNENPDQAADQYAGYAQYGFNKTVEKPRREGSQITYWMVSGREMFRFDARFFSRQTYECVLREAGFSELQWIPLSLDPAGVAAHGESYWQEYMDNPPVIGLECRV
jgi:ubiquinone/menaquinone biosynthesis C-methylase UbiE